MQQACRIGITPKRVYDMTPFELEAVFAGWESGREMRLWEMSYFAANLMSLQTKRPVKPKDLMKPFRKKQAASDTDWDKQPLEEQYKKVKEILRKGGRYADHC